jgi:hypothetical protein
MTEGRAELLRVLLVTHARYVAARCRVTSSAVYNWTSGRRRPCARCRRALRSYGIALEAWDREASTAFRAVYR